MQTFIINSQEVKFEIVNDKIFTNSLHVSKVFSKRHTHIMDIIRNYPSNFTEPNFRLGSYYDKQNQQRPMYEITRDGFSMLVMGFTGKKAFEWKVEFIEAFNKMEELLKTNPINVLTTAMNTFIKTQSETNTILLKNIELQTKLLQSLVDDKNKETRRETITKEQMKKIRSNVFITLPAMCECNPYKSQAELSRQLYTELNARFGVTSYYDILKDDFDEVIELQEKIITHWEEKREVALELKKADLERTKKEIFLL